MFRKKETELQYAPGIEKIIEDIQGGGTIARAGPEGIIDELPPLVTVGKDSDGPYHVVKTAKVAVAIATAATAVQVVKGHLFKVGEAITTDGASKGTSDLIVAINKGNASYDTIIVTSTIGAAAIGDMFILTNAEAAANTAKFKYASEATIVNEVNVTVVNQQPGLLARGTVNKSVMPYLIDKDLKATLGSIRFV